MDRLGRIASIHDDAAIRGYREFGEGPGRYGVPAAFRTITEHLPVAEWEVLDLGCGPGNLADFSNFKRYSGIDLSPEMLVEAGESGYSELIEGNMADYVANPHVARQEAVVALSCAYFLTPDEIGGFLANVDRLATKFWMVTLDGITPALGDLYRRGDGIDTYDHRGIALPWPDAHMTTIMGWRSVATEEDIMMDVVWREK